MKNGLLLFLLTILLGSLALPQSALPQSALPQSTTAPKNSPSKKVVGKSTATKAAPTKTASTKKGKSLKKSARPVASSWRPRQMAPTPDRYRDIQQALVDKGYLKSEPNGIWDAQSADALRQFQTDQKLSPTGKISSASLIALGLGPRTASPAESANGVPKPPETPPAAGPGTAPEAEPQIR